MDLGQEQAGATKSFIKHELAQTKRLELKTHVTIDKGKDTLKPSWHRDSLMWICELAWPGTKFAELNVTQSKHLTMR